MRRSLGLMSLAAVAAFLGPSMSAADFERANTFRPAHKRSRSKKTPKRRDDEREAKQFKIKGIRP